MKTDFGRTVKCRSPAHHGVYRFGDVWIYEQEEMVF